ncbi:TPA: acyltransferase, partial [Klebsiella pneumoniae]|nr:acyltransferase [Klebsiella pneumoniae]
MKKNIFGIQYLRAYAALLVVFNHLWSTGGVISKYLGFDIIGGFGVDIFFVISGFIMAYTISDYSKPERFGIGWSFIKKRIHRIYPLHVLVLVPMILVYILECILKKDEVSIYSIIGSVFLLPDFTASSSYRMINPVEWTLVYEMIFYISLSAFIFITPGKKSCLIIYSIFLALVVLIINGFGFRGERLEWVNIKYIVGDTIFLDFIMGFFVYYLS